MSVAMEPYLTKEQRRVRLALALMQRQVRTKTICHWTGLPRTKVAKLRRDLSYEAPHIKIGRQSGPFPKKMREFLRSPRTRNEAAALCGLCRAYGVIPPRPEPDAARYLPSIARGELLVVVYDMYRRLVPSTSISCEQLMGLLSTLVSGETYDIGCCDRTNCRAAILVDPLSVTARRLCMLCMHPSRRGAAPTTVEGDEAYLNSDIPPQSIQVTLFELIETEEGRRARPVAENPGRRLSSKSKRARPSLPAPDMKAGHPRGRAEAK